MEKLGIGLVCGGSWSGLPLTTGTRAIVTVSGHHLYCSVPVSGGMSDSAESGSGANLIINLTCYGTFLTVWKTPFSIPVDRLGPVASPCLGKAKTTSWSNTRGHSVTLIRCILTAALKHDQRLTLPYTSKFSERKRVHTVSSAWDTLDYLDYGDGLGYFV